MGPRLGAHTPEASRLVLELGAVTGRRRLRAVTVPAGMLLAPVRAVGLIQRIVPVHIPFEFEGAYFCWCAARSDDTRTRTELGVAPRDIQVTLAEGDLVDGLAGGRVGHRDPAARPVTEPPGAIGPPD